MFKKMKKAIEANRAHNEQTRELAFLLGGLAWLEGRLAHIEITDDEVTVAIYEVIDGLRIRRAVGIGECLSDAIKNAADIMDAQDGMESH